MADADVAWLDSKIKLLSDKMTDKHLAPRMSPQRKIVDLRNKIIEIKQLIADIENETDINMKPHLIAYLNLQ